MATSGSTSASGSWASATLEVSRTGVNVGSNYSTFYYKLSIYRQYNISSSAAKSYSIVINGQTVASGTTTIGGSGTKVIKEGYVDVWHNADGSKNLSFSFSHQFDVTLSSTWVGWLGNSGSFWVDSIPRTSNPSISASSTPLGNQLTIYTNRASTGFTHTLVCGFGNQQFNIAFDVGDSYTWTVPASLADAIPNASSGWGGITCHTYSGGTYIGSSVVNFTITVPDNATFLPTFTGISHAETVSAVSSGVGKYVQGMSKIKLDITGASAKYSASITSYSIDFDGVPYSASSVTTNVVKGSGTIRATATITDSRGKKATKTLDLSVLAYTPPSVSQLTLERANSNGTLNQLGTSVKVTRVASSASLLNGTTQKNVLKYTIKTKLRNASTWTTTKAQVTVSGISLTGSDTISTFDATKSYDIMIEVTDLFNTTIALGVVSSGQVTMSWGRTGIGIGKVWESGALDVSGTVNIEGTTNLAGNMVVNGDINFSGGIHGIIGNPSTWTKIDPNGQRFIMTIPKARASTADILFSIEDTTDWVHNLDIKANGDIVTRGNIEISQAGRNFIAPNNYGYMGKDTGGTADYMMYMGTDNSIHVGYANRRTIKVDGVLEHIGSEARFSNGTYSDPRDNYGQAIKASGGIATDYIYIKNSAILNGNDLTFNFPNGQYMIMGQGSGATIFRGHQTRLVFHDGAPHLRVESWNGGYCEINVGGTVYKSDRKIKKNVETFYKSALKEIRSTQVYEYNHEGEVDGVDRKHVGLMLQEAPLELIGSFGQGIDSYAMMAMMWRALQELDEEVDYLKRKLAKR